MIFLAAAVYGLFAGSSGVSAYASDIGGAGLLKKVDACAPQKGTKSVFFIKQWHLSPEVDTTNFSNGKKQPQYQNQWEIYEAIDRLLADHKMDTAVAEGCEGKIDAKFKAEFNGWSFEKLKHEVSSKNYPSILTHVLLKAAAKYPDQLKVWCGDDLSQIKYAQLALSDLRGDVGYWQRIIENENNPEKLKIYTSGVIEMLKLASSTTTADVVLSLKKDVIDSFQKFSRANAERDDALVRAIKRVDSAQPIVVVYGGLHTDDLKTKFQEEKWNCEIYEPKSYQNNEEKLLDEFKKLTK